MVAFAQSTKHPAAPASRPARLGPLAVLEVVRHPRGGWTIAAPVDASRSALRVYQGNYSSRRAAQRVLELEFLVYAR
jgi:hypothetical protein